MQEINFFAHADKAVLIERYSKLAPMFGTLEFALCLTLLLQIAYWIIRVFFKDKQRLRKGLLRAYLLGSFLLIMLFYFLLGLNKQAIDILEGVGTECSELICKKP